MVTGRRESCVELLERGSWNSRPDSPNITDVSGDCRLEQRGSITVECGLYFRRGGVNKTIPGCGRLHTTLTFTWLGLKLLL